MKHKFLVWIVAVIFWSVSLCIAPPQGHACCPESKANKQAPEMLCCLKQSVVEPVLIFQQYGDSDGDTPVALASIPPNMLGDSLEKQMQSLQSRQFIKDESSRYLELRVLLN